MAFVASKLRKLAEGLFVYDAQADSAATVSGAGYFNAHWAFLKVNDVIHVIGAGKTTLDVMFVSAVATNAVTVVAAEGVTAT